uniref:Ubiquitinyl hydrolase 1 n=1 Tax=Rhizophora mucronata TaxID=61149 RepID=A0A2P2KV60_RHIMU
MQNQEEEPLANDKTTTEKLEAAAAAAPPPPLQPLSDVVDCTSYFADDDVDHNITAFPPPQSHQVPFVGDKEPLSALAAEYESGSPILLEKIKLLGNQYVAIRRTRGDGNCFFRSFMFAYLEHLLEAQDQAEVDRVKINVEECRKMLQSLGYVDFTFEDFFTLFLEQLDSVLGGTESPIRCHPFTLLWYLC